MANVQSIYDHLPSDGPAVDQDPRRKSFSVQRRRSPVEKPYRDAHSPHVRNGRHRRTSREPVFNAAGTAFEKLTGKNIYDAMESDHPGPDPSRS